MATQGVNSASQGVQNTGLERPSINRLNDTQIKTDQKALEAAIGDFGVKLGLQAQLLGKDINIPNMEVKYG